jgi:trigger factor
MKVEKVKEDKLLREYNVTIPANDITKRIDDKLAVLGKKVSLPGFRKGKVPLDVVKKKYKDEVLGEVIQEIVDSSSRTAITDNKLKPATQPSVEITSYADGKDLTYKMSVEVMPEIPEVKFDKISLKKQVAKISDADITKLIEEVAKNSKDFKPVTTARSAKTGDAVLIDFEGFVAGVAFAGGKGEGHRLELGSNTFIPGFEEQLVGSKKGEETTVKVTFPKEYHSADLAGKPAEFKIKIHDVLESVKAEINDEFAKKIGQKDLASLKTLIQTNLEADAKEMSRVLIKKDLFDALEKAVKFDLPAKMVESELNSIIQQVKSSSDYGGHGHVHTDSCDHSKDDEKLKKEYGQLAKRRVLLGILVTDIASREKIQVTNEEMNHALMNEASRYPGQEAKVVEFYRKNPQALQNLSGPVIEEKVVDKIFEMVKISDVETTFDKLRELVLENNKE